MYEVTHGLGTGFKFGFEKGRLPFTSQKTEDDEAALARDASE